jgi:L-rhamnose isomerase/sugar isomerase
MLGGYEILRDAYATDARPLLAELREDIGLDPDPLDAYRRSGHQDQIERARVGGKAASW